MYEQIDVELERPKTSKGRRRRPTSRLGRRPIHDTPEDLEGDGGRPASRRGFTPETYERHDYDEFSRHIPDSPTTPEYSRSPNYMAPHPPGAHYSMSPTYTNNEFSQEHAHNENIYRNRQMSREMSDEMLPSSPSMYSDRPVSRDKARSFTHYERRYSESREEEINLSQIPPSGYRHSRYSPQTESSYNQDSPSHDQRSYKRDSLTVPFERPSSGYPLYDRQSSPKSESQNYSGNYSPEMAPQVSPRPKSSRKRPRSARRTAAKNPQLQIEGQPADDPLNTPVLRPQSSLSRYKPLPAIGTMIDPSRADEYIDQSLSPQTHVLKLHDNDHSPEQIFSFENENIPDSEINGGQRSNYRLESESSDQFSGQTFENPSLHQHCDVSYEQSETGIYEPETTFKPHFLPQEPTDEETRILLAVRLLNGQRHERHFRPTEQLDLVLQFAENMGMQDLSAYNLACNAPRLVFTDMTNLIGDSGLVERTVLYLEQR